MKFLLKNATPLLLIALSFSLFIIFCLVFALLSLIFHNKTTVDQLKMGAEHAMVAGKLFETMDLDADPCEDFYQYTCGRYKDHEFVSWENTDKFTDWWMTGSGDKDSIITRLIQRISESSESCDSEKELAKFHQSCIQSNDSQNALEAVETIDEIFRNSYNFSINEAENYTGSYKFYQKITNIELMCPFFSVYAPKFPYYTGGHIVVNLFITELKNVQDVLPILSVSLEPNKTDYAINNKAVQFITKLIAQIDRKNVSKFAEISFDDVLGIWLQFRSGKWRKEEPSLWMLFSYNKTEDHIKKLEEPSLWMFFSYYKMEDHIRKLEGLFPNFVSDENHRIKYPADYVEDLMKSDLYQNTWMFMKIQYLSALHQTLMAISGEYKRIVTWSSSGDKYDTELSLRGHREKHCTQLITDFNATSTVLSNAYMKLYLGTEAFEETDKQMRVIIKTTIEMLDQIENVTTRESIKRIVKQIEVGPVLTNLDCVYSDNLMKGLRFDGNKSEDFVSNWLALRQFNKDVYYSYGSEEPSYQFEVNAWYSRRNILGVSPFWIGQYFTKYSPIPANYGFLGQTIAHELVHKFYKLYFSNQLGHTNEPWDNKTMSNFEDFMSCTHDRYKYHGFEEENFLEENIPDVIGLQIALEAMVKNEDLDSIHKSLQNWPGLNKFSPKQLFFITYAQTNCEVALNDDLIYDDNLHPPGRARSEVGPSFLPQFAQVFNCAANSRVIEGPQCKIWPLN